MPVLSAIHRNQRRKTLNRDCAAPKQRRRKRRLHEGKCDRARLQCNNGEATLNLILAYVQYNTTTQTPSISCDCSALDERNAGWPGGRRRGKVPQKGPSLCECLRSDGRIGKVSRDVKASIVDIALELQMQKKSGLVQN